MHWDEDDVKAVTDVIRRGSYWACGPEIELFESKFANYINRKYALAFNSGTSALYSILLAHRIDGYEVIVPSLTFVSTVTAVSLAGGTPVFADIEDETLALDFDSVQDVITCKTRAIIPVHYAGCPAKEIDALQDIASDNGIFLIEDAAEALGAGIDGTKVGEWGDSAMFSFCQNKIISTGEGGMAVTDNEIIYERLKLIRSHGRLEKPSRHFPNSKVMDTVALGYNYRMPSMCAALGASQLNKVDELIASRRSVASYLDNGLAETVVETPNAPDKFFHVYQMYVIQTNDRDNLLNHLRINNIDARVCFEPAHMKEIYRSLGSHDLPNTERIVKRIIALPMYGSIPTEYLNKIIDVIKKWKKS